jgi:hypothetical protein
MMFEPANGDARRLAPFGSSSRLNSALFLMFNDSAHVALAAGTGGIHSTRPFMPCGAESIKKD